MAKAKRVIMGKKPTPSRSSKSAARLQAAPTNQGYTWSSRQPKVNPVGNGERVVHRERWYSTPVVGTVAGYAGQRDPFLPQNGLLPWLNQRSTFYSKYKINSLRFIYEPFVGVDTAGQIVMGVFKDGPDATRWVGLTGAVRHAALEQVCPATYGPCWSGASITVPGNQLHQLTSYFPVTGTLTTDADYRLAVPCSLAISVYDPQGINRAFGTVYVEYDLTFFDPVPPSVGVSFQLPAVTSDPGVSAETVTPESSRRAQKEERNPIAIPIHLMSRLIFFEETPYPDQMDRDGAHSLRVLSTMAGHFEDVTRLAVSQAGFDLPGKLAIYAQAFDVWMGLARDMTSVWRTMGYSQAPDVTAYLLAWFCNSVDFYLQNLLGVSVQYTQQNSHTPSSPSPMEVDT